MNKANKTALYHFYKNVVIVLQKQGYTSHHHQQLINCVLDPNQGEEEFYEILSDFDNCQIEKYRTCNVNLNNCEKLIGVWKKRGVFGPRGKTLLYFANVPDDKSTVNVQEISTAYSYLVHFKLKSLLFLHINELSTASYKQLRASSIAPSREVYDIRIWGESTYRIDISDNFYVPKHEKVENPETFYEREGLTKGTLPKIFKNDPAIVHLDIKPGKDIIKIYREAEFGPIESLVYREVIDRTIDRTKLK